MTTMNQNKNMISPTSHIAEFVLCALFAALTSVCSWISIPLPFTPVPVNLATLAVMLSGLILGVKFGTLSQILYLLLGAVGVPVFSGGTSGLGVMAGPTGGYLVGYILCAAVCGFLFRARRRVNNTAVKENPRFMPLLVRAFLAMAAGIAACYFAGTIWFMYLTGNGLISSLFLCVIPFIPGDILKMTASFLLIKRLPQNSLRH